MSNKPWLDQLKVITATRTVMVQASPNLSIGKRKENTNKEGEILSDKNKYEASAAYQAR